MTVNSAIRYRAAAANGEIRTGVLDVADPATAKHRLQTDGLAVIELREVAARAPRRVRRQDMAVALRNVAILVAHGVPLEKALAASESLVSGRLRDAFVEVRAALREGRSISDAMAAQPDVFSSTMIGTMLAGDRGGRLADACEAMADQLESDARSRDEIRSALTYPLMVLTMGVASVIVMGAFVVPRFAATVESMGAELPTATRLLLTTSAVIRRYGLLFVVGLAGVVTLLVRWTRVPAVRARLDAVLLRAPLIGPLRLSFSSARFCRCLGGMLTTGLPLLSALDAAQGSAGDHELARRLERVRDAVARGERLTESLSAERAVSPLAVQLVGVGESSGQLGSMLTRAGQLVAEQAQRSLRALMSLVEPLLVIVLGAFVAAIAGALLQAVYAVRP